MLNVMMSCSWLFLPLLGQTVVSDNPLMGLNTHDRSKTIYALWSDGNGQALAAAESGSIGTWDQKTRSLIYEQLDPTVDFYDVHGSVEGTAYAVGTRGAFFQRKKGVWRALPTPTDRWLEAVWSRHSNEVFAAGDDGLLLTYDGADFKKLRTGVPNRLYSIAGDAEKVYVVGSYGTILRVDGTRVRSIPTVISSHLLGIQHVPGTQKFIVCGSNGTLFWLENDRIEAIETGIYSSFYAVDAQRADRVAVAGWQGETLVYDGVSWVRRPLGNHAYMEAVVFTGPDQLLSAGWYGKVFQYQDEAWFTRQAGRAEAVRSLVIHNNRWSAGGDQGQWLTGDVQAGSAQLSYHRNGSFRVIGQGKEGRLGLIDKRGQLWVRNPSKTELVRVSPRAFPKTHAHSQVGTAVWLADARGKLYQWTLPKSPGLQADIDLSDTLGDESIRDVHWLSGSQLIILTSQNRWLIWDRRTQVLEPLESTRAFERLAKTEGVLFGIAGSEVWRIDRTGSWRQWANLPEPWLLGERVSAAYALDKDTLLVGGTLGSIFHLHTEGQPRRAHSGVLSEITALAAQGQMFIAGFRRGHVAWGQWAGSKRWFSTLSAPFYRRIEASGTAFVFGGELGHWGTADPNTRRVNLQQNQLGDILTSCALGKGYSLFAGAGHLGFISPTGTANFQSVPYVLTAVGTMNDLIWLGDADGRIWQADRTAFMSNDGHPSTWERMGKRFQQIPVLFAGTVDNPQVVGRNGMVGVWKEGRWQERLTFAKTRIYPSSTQPTSDRLLLAGSPEFLVEWSGQMVTLPKVPDSIRNLSCYGTIDNQLWVGGSSGSLLYRNTNGQWSKVHTGIGNRLYGIAANEDYLMIVGSYGSIRFERRSNLHPATLDRK